MVQGRSTPVVFGGHFHVTRVGMFRSRAGLALNPWSTAASPRLAYRHRPYLHTQGVIRTAPPSRSRVKNDYSIIGMLSRGKDFPLPLVGRGKGWGATFAKTPPCPRFARTSLPTRGREQTPAHLPRERRWPVSSPAMTWWGRVKQDQRLSPNDHGGTRKRPTTPRLSPDVAMPALPACANGR